MKFERIKKSHTKGIVIGVISVSALILLAVYAGSRAKYKVTQSIPLVNGTINYEIGDFNVVAMYTSEDGTNYTEVDKMPESGYVINEEKSYCKVNGTKDNNARLYTNTKGEHIVGNLQKFSKCYVYFDVKKDPKTVILAGRTKAERGAITAPLTSNGNTVYYEAEDDDGVSQYLAGNVTNNWVQFAGFYWRIIRINGDGSIRMIYNGTTTDQTGETTQIGTKAFNAKSGDDAYVGYMYGTTGSSTYAATHANINNSDIKTELDYWYKINIVDAGYNNKVNTDTGFCNDRKVDKNAHSSYPGDGYGTKGTGYAPWGRLYTNGESKTTQTPILKCAQIADDLFTVSGSSKGNKKLTYPVGLITSDEVVFAGGFGGKSNNIFYLFTNQDYWTMSPKFKPAYGSPIVFYMCSDGFFSRNQYTSSIFGIRPVINLSLDVKLIGTGTTSDPYKVV